MEEERNPPAGTLASILLNRNIVDLCANVISKLEFIERDKAGRVFRTPWAGGAFEAAVRELGAPSDFKIDEWFAKIPRKHSSSCAEDAREAMHARVGISTNWLLALLETERLYPGFMMLLNNILNMEDDTFRKLNAKTTSESHYPQVTSALVSAICGVQKSRPLLK